MKKNYIYEHFANENDHYSLGAISDLLYCWTDNRLYIFYTGTDGGWALIRDRKLSPLAARECSCIMARECSYFMAKQLYPKAFEQPIRF